MRIHGTILEGQLSEVWGAFQRREQLVVLQYKRWVALLIHAAVKPSESAKIRHCSESPRDEGSISFVLVDFVHHNFDILQSFDNDLKLFCVSKDLRKI